MAATLIVCPNCSARLQLGAAGGHVRCGRCGTVLVVERPRADVPVARPAPPPPAATPAQPPEPSARSGPSRGALLVGLVAAGFLLLAGAAAVLALAFSSGKGKTDAPSGAASPATGRADRPPEVTHHDGREPEKGSEPGKPDPLDAPPPPTSLSAEEQQEVAKAIDRGLVYLKEH